MGELARQSSPQLYACQNCGRLAPIADFNDECRPGWTHGVLTKIDMASIERLRAEGHI